MTAPVTTIADAFKRLKQSVSEDDAYDFASTELADVWRAVREIDNKHRQSQSAQNLRRIEPFLRGLEKYSKVIEVLCNGTPYMPYIWAPIKLMLQIASHHRDVFEALLGAYEEIGAALPRFDRYEQAFKDNPAFHSVLASVYNGILEFHQRAYKFLKRRAWHVLFQSLWKDFGTRFAGIIDGLRKQRDFIDREAVSIDILESKEARIRAQEEIEQRQKQSLLLIEQNESILTNLQFQQSVAWLSVDDDGQGMRLERLCRRRHDETCGWIMEQPELKAWMKSDGKDNIVWLSGKPGAGKSVMSSYIVGRLLETEAIDTLYYFCTSQDIHDSCNLVLRTFALQLLRQHPDLASLISNEFFHKTCGLVQLRALLPKMLAASCSTRIILDGVDETSKEAQKLLLKELQTVCLANNPNCKILFSSRREVSLAKQLARKPCVVLDGRAEVNLDIKSFIKYKMQKVKTSNPELRESIELELIKNAGGMFLWVHLVVEVLRSCYSDWDLEKSSKSLPKGLEAAYGRILDRIVQEPAAALAISILEWMACSQRPLKVYELVDGISFRPENSSFDARPKMDPEVLNLCRPLIEYGSSNILEFVHFSAKEFILKSGAQGGSPFLNSSEAHLHISFSCVAYLNTAYSLLPNRSTRGQQAAAVATGLHGLLPYANRYWSDHLLTYCSSTSKPIPRSLVAQLITLVGYQKPPAVSVGPQAAEITNADDVKGLHALDQLPKVQSLILNARSSRNKAEATNEVDDFEKSIEDISHQDCDSDSTYFSTLGHNYQIILESLLDRSSWRLLPTIDHQTLQLFSDTYGLGAFTCRYLQCARAVDGFDSSTQRDTHEAAHKRQFRCDFPECINFTSGFAKRGALNRHNKQYHQSLDVTTSSLSELISGLHPLPSLRADKRSIESSTSLRRDEPTSRKISLATPAELLVSSTEVVEYIDSLSDVSYSPRSSRRSFHSEPVVDLMLGHSKGGIRSSQESQFLIVSDAMNERPIIDSVEEEPYTIKCICDYSDDDGNTIYCEKCDAWQHIECYYPGQVEDASREEFDHSCADCKPRSLILDRHSATDRQRLQRQQKANKRPPKKIQLPSLKHRSKETKTIRASSSFESSDHEIRPIVTTDDAGQLQLVQVQGPQGRRKQNPSSSNDDREGEVRQPTRNYMPESKVSDVRMDSPRSREGTGQQAPEQGSPKESTPKQLQKLTSDPYASYQDGQPFVIGMQRGSHFRCGHLGGRCHISPFITIEKLHTHFVREHFPCDGYMLEIATCQNCSHAITDVSRPCTNCNQPNTLEGPVYSTFDRYMYSEHQEVKKKAETTRRDIIHLLAVDPLSVEDLKDKLPNTRYDLLLKNITSLEAQICALGGSISQPNEKQ
ncbi:hypothetical protein BKA61DRAFT_612024 [Leptodontidium sp. MPI-SDFR-AT-0119]|nr:hypothetical protein BKA61DRAFT_612024 [Leptodontidium sp. MPI-SDFR-AT-0119]